MEGGSIPPTFRQGALVWAGTLEQGGGIPQHKRQGRGGGGWVQLGSRLSGGQQLPEMNPEAQDRAGVGRTGWIQWLCSPPPRAA